jgi:hypothetical protein
MMMRTSKVVGIVLATSAALVAILLLALWSPSSVAAVPSPLEQAGAISAPQSRPAQAAPTPVPGGPGYYSICSIEMRPDDSTIGYDIWGGLATTQESTINPLGITLYGAGLHLPQGARITKLVAYGYDDDAAEDCSFGIIRGTVTDTASSDFVVPMTASGTNSGLFVEEVTADEDYATVDNGVYYYAVLLNMPAASSGKDLRLYQFRVDYSFDSYLPAAMREY